LTGAFSSFRHVSDLTILFPTKQDWFRAKREWFRIDSGRKAMIPVRMELIPDETGMIPDILGQKGLIPVRMGLIPDVLDWFRTFWIGSGRFGLVPVLGCVVWRRKHFDQNDPAAKVPTSPIPHTQRPCLCHAPPISPLDFPFCEGISAGF